MREWVADVHGERSASACAEDEELGGERGASSIRIARGGGWSTTAEWCRAASRGVAFAATRGTTLGFRIAKSLPPRR